MLAALLAGKLDRELRRPPTEIEDLLTSVVFGACQYVSPDDALVPFLGMACNANGAKLAPLLADVVSVSYMFWPSWDRSPRDSPTSTTEVSATEDFGLDAQGNHRHAPDLVLAVARHGRPAAWILVEAKLLSGKSSRPTESGPVTDQLGKYWVELRRRAEAAGAVPLALVYVTPGLTLPDKDFSETQTELAAKAPAAAPAPLYWLSWRDFAEAATSDAAILQDVRVLLRERWQLIRAQMLAWPAAPRTMVAEPTGSDHAPPWTFTQIWRWPLAPVPRVDWRFSEEAQRHEHT